MNPRYIGVVSPMLPDGMAKSAALVRGTTRPCC
jgi:hypothetical protein